MIFPVCQDIGLCLACKCDLNDVTLHNEFLERKRFLGKHVIIPLTSKVIYFKRGNIQPKPPRYESINDNYTLSHPNKFP